MKATNLEIGVIVTMRAAVEKDGEIAIPAAVFASIIDGMEGKKIILEKKGNNIAITTENCSATVNGVNAKEFPLIPIIKGDVFLKISGRSIARSIEQVLPSMAVSSMRPDLAGVFVVQNEEGVSFVATDGFRLSEKKIFNKKASQGTGDVMSMIIPGKTASEIARIFDSREDSIELLVGENQLAVKAGEIYLVSRVIDGNFPDYTQIIPKTHKTRASINKDALVSAIKLAAVFADSTTNDITLRFKPKGGILSVSTQSQNTGNLLKDVKGKIEGDSNTIVLNYRYLLDGVMCAEGKNVNILIGEESAPIMVMDGEEGGKPATFMYLISPIKKQQ